MDLLCNVGYNGLDPIGFTYALSHADNRCLKLLRSAWTFTTVGGTLGKHYTLLPGKYSLGEFLAND